MNNTLILLALLAGGLLFPSKSQAQTPTDKQLQAIEKYMAPLRKKVTDILEADKSGQYQTYKSDLARIAKESDLARQGELIEKLERDHYDFIKTAYRSVVINHEEMRREVARILGHSKFALGEFGDIQIDFTPFGPPSIPIRFDTEFSCPMTAVEHSESSQAGAACVAQFGSCSMDVQAIAEITGGCRGKVHSGDNFVLPDGPYTKIMVTAQTDLSYNGIALAVGGYSQINAKYGIRFKAPGLDKVVLTKELFTLAPLVWLSRLRGDATNFISQATFTGNFPVGATITAQVYLEGFALAVPAVSLTWIKADTDNIDFIRLNGSN